MLIADRPAKQPVRPESNPRMRYTPRATSDVVSTSAKSLFLSSTNTTPQAWAMNASESLGDVKAELRRNSPDLAHIDLLLAEQRQILAQRGKAMVTTRPLAKSAWDIAWLATPLLSTTASVSAPPRIERGHANTTSFTPAMPFSLGSNQTMEIFTPRAPLPVYEAFTETVSAPKAVLNQIHQIYQLQPDWIDALDLTAFDEIVFFRECDVSIDRSASFEARLAAAYECLKPALSNIRSGLSIDGFNAEKSRLFFRHFLAALNLGGIAQEELDPAFAQILFERWFASLAAPPTIDNDGNKKRSAFPLQALLLELTHGMYAATAGCQITETVREGASAMRMDRMHAVIAAAFTQENPTQLSEVRTWILRALLGMFEPSLVRPDLPPFLHYGDLEWTLLGIGIRLAGERHWQYNHQELIALAVAADVFGESGESADDAQDVMRQTIGIVLRMAHAAGVIDLRDTGADVGVALQTAIALFSKRMDARRRSNADISTDVPTRRDIAILMLKDCGMNPAQRFTLFRPQGYGRDLLGSQTKALACLKFNQSYTLVDFFMADCMTQLFIHGRLPGPFSDLLHKKSGVLSHAALNQRFRQAFDAAFDALADGVVANILTADTALMSERDAYFWHCGSATVRIPKATILTRIPPRANLGASGAGRPFTAKQKDYPATGALLVQLKLESEADNETRHYWVALEPLTVTRFNGDVENLLAHQLHQFFKATRAQESLLRLADHTQIHYRTVTNDKAGRSTAQFVGRHLLAPRLPKAREMAFQVTDAELFRENFYQSLLDILPFRACMRTLAAGESYQAAFFCATDVLSLIPFLAAGGRVAGSAMRAGAALSVTQSRKLASHFLRGVVERKMAPQLVSTTLQIGVPLLNFGTQAVQFLNPVQGMRAGLSWLGTRLGHRGHLLLQRLKKITKLQKLTTDIERSIASRRKVYLDQGFWHAMPGTVTMQHGRRQLQLDGKTYLVLDMGAHKNILALQQGRNLRLASPESGRVFGPPLSGAADLADGQGSMQYALRRLCGGKQNRRRKRSDSEMGNDISSGSADCNGIQRALKFGHDVYRFSDKIIFNGFQTHVFKGYRKKVQLSQVNLNDIGFTSYSLEEQAGKLVRIHNDRYFAFNEEIWIAKNRQLESTSIVFPFPERLSAHIVYLTAPRKAMSRHKQGTYYVVFDIELPSIENDLAIYFNRFIAPYGNYPGNGGACMGMVEVPGASYRFTYAKNWKERPLPGQNIALVKATRKEFDIFERYQQINADARRQRSTFEPASLRQLKAVDKTTRRRFDIVFNRAGQLIEAARQALASRSLAVELVLYRFMPSMWSEGRKAIFVVDLKENIEDIRSALPMVRRNKRDVIGFGIANRIIKSNGRNGDAAVSGEEYIRAEALSGSMNVNMDFNHINKALIYFDETHFANMPIDTLASDFVHELSHARFQSRDTISGQSTVEVYPSISLMDNNLIDIMPLVEAAARAGSDSVNHASTFEYLVVALAYTQADDTLPLLHSFFNGGTRFSHRPDQAPGKCGGSCVLLR